MAGDVILPGGVDVEAGTFPSTCVGLTSLVQNAQSETDLYEPGTGSGGTFVASTGALNQAREGASQGVIGAGTNETLIMLGGGACTNGEPGVRAHRHLRGVNPVRRRQRGDRFLRALQPVEPDVDGGFAVGRRDHDRCDYVCQ